MNLQKLLSSILSVLITTALLLISLPAQPAYAASIVVNTNADNTTAGDGNCTLREAINNAEADSDTTSGDCVAGSGADVITFAADYTITLDGTLGQLPGITTTITINGNGAANTIIEANAAANTATYRVFGVSGGGTLTLDAMTVRNGVSDSGSGQSGGGIYNGGTLTITNSQISGNYVKGVGSIGGGIYNNGTLTLTDSTVTGNHADELASQGGGIYNYGTLIINGSTISNNSADGTASQGGGIYNHDAMTITDSIISGNHANGTTSEGGGILSDSTKSVSITNSTVSSNQATGSSGLGGGIFNVTNPLTITDSTISGNSATSYGGIFNFNGTLTITGSTINGNTATSQTGGGVSSTGQMFITNSTIAGNDGGSSFGGGIYYAGSATSTLTNVTISGNTAGTSGGGIFVSAGTLNLTNSIVANQIGGGDCDIFGGGLITSGGYNIEGGTTCGFTQASDQQSVTSGQLNLGALADNGGPTQTMSINNTSAAFNAGDNTTCAASPVSNVDQRGVTRPQVGQCDIGAFEAGADFIATKTNSVGGTAVLNQTFNWIITVQQIGDINLGIGDARVILADELPDSGATYGTPTLQNSSGVVGTITCSITGFDLECVTNGLVTFLKGSSFQIVIPVTPTAIGTLENPGSGDFVCAVDPVNVVTETFEDNNDCADTVTVADPIPTPTPTPTSTSASNLPSTGFRHGQVTSLPVQPAAKTYADTAMILEIPKLGLSMPIVGVPQSDESWDVTWLGNNAGWLNGSAFPTWAGNTVLTGHVWDAYNQPGPFAELKTLKYGDQFTISAYGQTYTYEVRENKLLWAKSGYSQAFQHEEYDWVTLLTCEHYNPFNGDYFFRRAVRAVLVSVK